VNGLRRISLSIVVLLGAIVLALAAPGEAVAMPGHATTSHAMPDAAVPDTGGHGVPAHHAGVDDDGGGCPMGLMGGCCVMTCCAATVPEIMPGTARHLVIAARSSRPTVACGRAILPPLKPPKRLL